MCPYYQGIIANPASQWDSQTPPTDKWILLTGIEVLEMQGTIPAVAKTDSYEFPLGGSAEGVDFLIIKFDFSAMW